MPSLTYYKSQKADEIIAEVESSIDDDIDEEVDVAGWVYNELAMAVDFLNKLKPGVEFPDIHSFQTVEDMKDILMSFEHDDLEFIRHFIVDIGGTSADELFVLREQTPEDIKAWFDENAPLAEQNQNQNNNDNYSDSE